MIPDLSILSQFAELMGDWEQGGTTPQAMLHRAAPLIRQLQPAVTGLRLYRVQGTIMVPLAATDDDEIDPDTTIPLQQNERYAYVPDAPASHYLAPDHSAWLLLPEYEGRRFLALEVLRQPEAPAAGEADLLRHLAGQMAVSLARRDINLLLSRQAQITARLATCETYRDVAEVLGKELLSKGQFVSVNLVQRDAQGRISGFRTMATANRHQSYKADFSVPLPADNLSPTVRQLMAGGQPVIIRDLPTSDAIEDGFKISVSGRPILSVAAFPIRTQDNAMAQGIIILNDTRVPICYSEKELHLMQTLVDQVGIVLDHRELLQETRRTAAALGSQVRVLQIINNVSGRLSGAINEPMLLSRACEILTDSVKADHTAVAMLATGGKHLDVVSEYPGKGAVGSRIPLDDPIQQRLISEKAPVMLNQPGGNDDLSTQTRQILTGLKVQHLLVLPMIDTNGAFVGSFGLSNLDADRPFTTDQVEIGQAIVAQIVVTLENIRLLRGTRRQASQMEQIAGFSQSVQSTLEISTLLEISVVSARQIIQSDHIAILLYDPLRQMVRCVASQDGVGAVQIKAESRESVDLVATTAGRVWQTEMPLRVENMRQEDGLRYTLRDDIVASLSLPLFSRGALNGVVEVGSTQTNAFTPADSAVMLQLASQLAVALENADTYQQTQRLARSKVLVNDISSKIQRLTTVDDILNVTLNELGGALGARRGRIRLSPEALQDDDEQEKPS